MEKLKIVRLLVVALLVCTGVGQAFGAPTLYNTGVEEDFITVRSAGSGELHWLLNGDVQPYVIEPNPAWVAAPAGSAWIGVTPTQETVPVAQYDYSLTFSLTNVAGSNIVLSGLWSSDNNSKILLNGTEMDSLDGEFAYLGTKSFAITTGFVEGDNVLTFQTWNMPTGEGRLNPNGLLVADLVITQTTIPAPGAIVLVSLGTCVIGFIRRKGIL